MNDDSTANRCGKFGTESQSSWNRLPNVSHTPRRVKSDGISLPRYHRVHDTA